MDLDAPHPAAPLPHPHPTPALMLFVSKEPPFSSFPTSSQRISLGNFLCRPDSGLRHWARLVPREATGHQVQQGALPAFWPVLTVCRPAGLPSCCSACLHCVPSGSSAWSTCSSSSSSGTRPSTPSSWRCWRPHIKPPRPLPPMCQSRALPGHSCSAPALSLPF